MNENQLPLSSTVADVMQLIARSRHPVALAVNAELTLLYWNVERIRQDVLTHERAEYGQQVVKSLVGLITQAYGRGWGRSRSGQVCRLLRPFLESQLYTRCVDY